MLLLQKDTEILPEHRQEALEIALWKITEADGKHNTQFRSMAACTLPDNELIHEHVFRIAPLARKLMNGCPEDIDRILEEKAVACLVTKDEHDSLHVDRELDGWERYRRARITVIDTRTNEIFRLPETS
jgi:hypothetical protein